MNNAGQDRRGIGALAVLILLATLVLILFLVLSFNRWEGIPPEVRFSRDFRSLGKSPDVSLQIEDPGTGLRQITVVLKQKDQTLTLVEQHYDGPSLFTFWRSGGQKSTNFDLGRLITEKYKV